MTTWLQDGTFTAPPDRPYLGFWRHDLERSLTASVFRFCLSGAAVYMMAHCATNLNEAFRSDFVSSSGSVIVAQEEKTVRQTKNHMDV